MEAFSLNILLGFCIISPHLLLGISALLATNGDDWVKKAERDLHITLNQKRNEKKAKNIIFFLGDAMSMSTVAAGRILKGQLKGDSIEPLVFEYFPNVAFSKTYSVDRQVADSASTATAYLCGAKTNFGVLGFDGQTKMSVCASEEEQSRSRVDSILKMAHNAGKLTGIVTNTRITHASPAGAYAHIADRDWESDNNMSNITEHCSDIAKQLIDENNYIRVLLGGGRRSFLPVNVKDPKSNKVDRKNGRLDGRNLIEDWKKDKKSKDAQHHFVWTKEQFDKVDPKRTDYLLGLFSHSHMSYDMERDEGPAGEPSLAEMTEKAIKILKRSNNGFFLFVEGGLIDYGHHDNQAKKALYDTLAFDKAIQKALDLVDIENTLLVVTADHSASFTLVGYPTIDNPIFGAVDKMEWGGSSDNLPYTTLVYSTGPGYKVSSQGKREDISKVDTEDKDYLQQSGIPMQYGTHTGEDVGIYAIGPWGHLYHGVHEQSYIPHVMAYAACLSKMGKAAPHCRSVTSEAPQLRTTQSGHLQTLFFVIYCILYQLS